MHNVSIDTRPFNLVSRLATLYYMPSTGKPPLAGSTRQPGASIVRGKSHPRQISTVLDLVRIWTPKV